jgi:hypothetical protein
MIEESTSRGCIQRLRFWTESYFSRLQDALYRAERDAQFAAEQGTESSIGGVVNLPRVIVEGSSSSSRARVVMMPPEYEGEHVEMGTSEQVARLVDQLAAPRHGILLYRRPSLLLGRQVFDFIQAANGKWHARTLSYRYILLTKTEHTDGWYGLRMESDPGASWLLNHPQHHFQFGFEEALRLQATGDRSIVGFVDLVLRMLAPDVWGRLYPDFYRALNDTGSALRAASPGGEAEHLRRLLREEHGSRERAPWYGDWEAWRQDLGVGRFSDEFMDVLRDSIAG